MPVVRTSYRELVDRALAGALEQRLLPTWRAHGIGPNRAERYLRQHHDISVSRWTLRRWLDTNPDGTPITTPPTDHDTNQHRHNAAQSGECSSA